MATLEAKDEQPTEIIDIPPPIPSVTEPQKQIAAQALQEFEKKNYGACCNLIHKLFTERSVDPKVVHNKSVAEFYQSGFLTTDEFRQSLDKVCQMVIFFLISCQLFLS